MMRSPKEKKNKAIEETADNGEDTEGKKGEAYEETAAADENSATKDDITVDLYAKPDINGQGSNTDAPKKS